MIASRWSLHAIAIILRLSHEKRQEALSPECDDLRALSIGKVRATELDFSSEGTRGIGAHPVGDSAYEQPLDAVRLPSTTRGIRFNANQRTLLGIQMFPESLIARYGGDAAPIGLRRVGEPRCTGDKRSSNQYRSGRRFQSSRRLNYLSLSLDSQQRRNSYDATTDRVHEF